MADRGYVRGLAAIWSSQVGEGVMMGGFMLLMEALGTLGSCQGLLALGVMLTLEQCVTGVCGLGAASERDNNKARERDDPAGLQRDAAKSLVRGAWLDLLTGVGFLGLATAAVFVGLQGWPVLLVATLLKVTQIGRRSFRAEAWTAIKPRLSETGALRNAPGMRSTTARLEMIVGTGLYAIASLCAFQVALTFSAAFPPLFLALGFTAITVGGILAFCPRLYFLRYL